MRKTLMTRCRHIQLTNYSHVMHLLSAVVFLVLSVFVQRASTSDNAVLTATSIVPSTTTSRSRAPHRGKVLSDPLHVNELYQAYREIQTNYRNKTLTSTDWRVLNAKDGVEVAIMEHEDDPTCPYVRMRAVLPVPVQDCWDFLRVPNWDRTMPIMDPFYEGVSVHGNFSSHPSVDILLCRKRMKRIFTFGKRDLVFLSVTEKQPLADGTWVSGTVSVHTPHLPRQSGYTRAFQDSVAFYKPIEDKNHTELTIICRIDLNDSGGDGGWIPMYFYVKTIGYTGAQSVLRMKKALVEAFT